MKIGLLPLYIALYDQASPSLRPRLENFYNRVACQLESEGLEVIKAPFCRIKDEFCMAISDFENKGAEAVVTLHLAYSPSLESAEALVNTRLPLVVLDTTDTFNFGFDQQPSEISYCHGIHGVMDMCNLLLRGGKAFAIAAGHADDSAPLSDVFKRTAGFLRAAQAANALVGSRTGRIAGIFDGMGDFAVSSEEMKERFDVTVVEADPRELSDLRKTVSHKEIQDEIEQDIQKFKALNPTGIESSVHERSVRDGLAVRRWLEINNYAAFSATFLNIGPEVGLLTMPMMEACKAMERGIGYAGEGDVLTASFTGALLQGFPNTSFVEIFCPDWQGNTLFLSHMSEMNLRLVSGKPEMTVKPFVYGKGENPVTCYGCFRSGSAVFVNIFRGKDGFCLLISPVTMEQPSGNNQFTGHVRGWMRPQKSIARFLEELSLAGATHHSILVYDAEPEQLRFFGKILGLTVIEI